MPLRSSLARCYALRVAGPELSRLVLSVVFSLLPRRPPQGWIQPFVRLIASWKGLRDGPFTQIQSGKAPVNEMQVAERGLAVAYTLLRKKRPEIFPDTCSATGKKLDALMERLQAADVPDVVRFLPVLGGQHDDFRKLITASLKDLADVVRDQGEQVEMRLNAMDGEMAHVWAKAEALGASKADQADVDTLRAQMESINEKMQKELVAMSSSMNPQTRVRLQHMGQRMTRDLSTVKTRLDAHEERLVEIERGLEANSCKMGEINRRMSDDRRTREAKEAKDEEHKKEAECKLQADFEQLRRQVAAQGDAACATAHDASRTAKAADSKVDAACATVDDALRTGKAAGSMAEAACVTADDALRTGKAAGSMAEAASAKADTASRVGVGAGLRASVAQLSIDKQAGVRAADAAAREQDKQAAEQRSAEQVTAQAALAAQQQQLAEQLTAQVALTAQRQKQTAAATQKARHRPAARRAPRAPPRASQLPRAAHPRRWSERSPT